MLWLKGKLSVQTGQTHYLVNGHFLVGLYPFFRNRRREELFQEIIDRLEQDNMEPTLRHEPPASFSSGEHPPDDEDGQRNRKKVHGEIEGQFG